MELLDIEKEALRRYPDCEARGWGTGDFEYGEDHGDERETFVDGAILARDLIVNRASTTFTYYAHLWALATTKDEQETVRNEFITYLKNSFYYGV